MKRFFVLSIFLLGVVFLSTQERSTVVTEPDLLSMPKREPASVPKTQTAKRDWIGKKDEIIKTGQIKFENKPTPKWESRLLESLKRGLEDNIEVTVKNERDLIITKGTKALNVQQVVVIFQSTGNRSSYRAMVDSSNGKILRTWDHTIHENFARTRRSHLTAFPLQN